MLIIKKYFMKNLLNLGKVLDKEEQKSINGGSGSHECIGGWQFAICDPDSNAHEDNPCILCVNL